VPKAATTGIIRGGTKKQWIDAKMRALGGEARSTDMSVLGLLAAIAPATIKWYVVMTFVLAGRRWREEWRARAAHRSPRGRRLQNYLRYASCFAPHENLKLYSRRANRAVSMQVLVWQRELVDTYI